MKKRYILGGLFLIVLGIGGIGFYRAQTFLSAVKEAGNCANADILLERKIVFDLYQKDLKHQQLTLAEQAFLQKMALKYRKKFSRTLLLELYQDLTPLPPALYQAQAFLITHGGWGGHTAPFGTYSWEQGRYQKQHFQDLCDAALAFAYDIQMLPEFKVMRHMVVRLLEDDRPVQASKLLVLVPAKNAAEQAYLKRLSAAVKRFE